MTLVLAHAGHYTGLFLFGPVLLIALWLFVSDKLERRRRRRDGVPERGDRDDSRR